MREEAAQRRGKFFAAPVSGLAGLVQVIRLETGTRGPEHGARKWKELNGLTIGDTLRDPETQRFLRPVRMNLSLCWHPRTRQVCARSRPMPGTGRPPFRLNRRLNPQAESRAAKARASA